MRYLVHMGLAFIVITLNSPGTFGAVQSSNPPGPYQQSCKEIEVKGHTLRARCPDSNGKLRPAELKDFEGCRGEITNNDGTLRCKIGEEGPPAGPYTKTCRDIRLRGSTLQATCQNGDGQWNETSLRNVRKCDGEIINADGELRCRR